MSSKKIAKPKKGKAAPDRIVRDRQMNLRISAHEEKLRDQLAAHFGTDGAGVMRMSLLELARKAGIK